MNLNSAELEKRHAILTFVMMFGAPNRLPTEKRAA